MIKKKCPTCGASMAFFKSCFASKTITSQCSKCMGLLYRNHFFSKSLVLLVGSIGLLNRAHLENRSLIDQCKGAL